MWAKLQDKGAREGQRDVRARIVPHDSGSGESSLEASLPISYPSQTWTGDRTTHLCRNQQTVNSRHVQRA